MKKNKNKYKLFFLVFGLTGCASQTGWSPTVDPYGDPNAYRLNQDMAECSQLAHRASGGLVKESAKGMAIGGLVGAGAGAALGAISGDPATGAMLGATIGGIGGGAKQGIESDARYKQAYSNCLRHRGHSVLN